MARLGLQESVLWPIVDEVLCANRHLMGQDLESRVFSENWELKAMWTMRMDSAITEYTFREVQNPLLQFRSGDQVC